MQPAKFQLGYAAMQYVYKELDLKDQHHALHAGLCLKHWPERGQGPSRPADPAPLACPPQLQQAVLPLPLAAAAVMHQAQGSAAFA